mmetsp:Transcript_14395/g.28783  ORF Transcript_14395/g.28783 Transcript_14395/m.28783 type:complete len:206 (-) Transcript_14395:130-747(-)
MGLSKRHFMPPCVPTLSMMCPWRPCFVLSLAGLNHATSSGFSNMCRTVACRLCTRTGNPVSTARFSTTRSASTPDTLPDATSVRGVPSGPSAYTNTGQGAYASGPYADMVRKDDAPFAILPGLRKRSNRRPAPRPSRENTGRARHVRDPATIVRTSLDLTGGRSPGATEISAWRTPSLFSWGRRGKAQRSGADDDGGPARARWAA